MALQGCNIFAMKITKARNHEESLRYSVFFVIFVIFVIFVV